jgi:hypothetical protein
MDAHAWVEAWDEAQRQWRIVEATPGEDLGIALADDELDNLLGGGGSVLTQLIQTLYEYGLFGVPSWLYDSYGLLGAMLPPAALFGAASCVALLRRRRKRNLNSRSQSYRAGNPGLANLHRMLARMDRRVRAAGVRREISETLHAFARRLRARDPGDGHWTGISDWYVEYAQLRYCRTLSPDRIEQLATGLHDSQ